MEMVGEKGSEIFFLFLLENIIKSFQAEND